MQRGCSLMQSSGQEVVNRRRFPHCRNRLTKYQASSVGKTAEVDGPKMPRTCELSKAAILSGMTSVDSWWLAGVSLVLLFASQARAQSWRYQPEIDTYIGLHRNVRFAFQAEETREDGSPIQAEIGPSIEFYWRVSKNLIPNGVDKSKTSFIVLSIGYHYLPSPDEPATNRILLVATPRIPLRRSKLVVSDRNRGEINFSNGDLTWRYRNRLQLERQLTIRPYHPTPFANVEVFYNSSYQKRSSTRIQVGCQFPVRSHVQIDVYYEHDNNTGVTPNQQVNLISSVLSLHF